MSVFFGTFALFFYSLLVGAFWASRQPHEAGVLVWDFFAKSLYLSWFIFIVSFLTPLGDISRVFIVAGFFASTYFLSRSETVQILVPASSSALNRVANFICVSAAILLCGPIFASIGTIFTGWDPVVSWNRWAMELSGNVYRPVNAAYPILFPALWSLIYEAQQTPDLWVIAKASLVIPPFLLLALIVSESFYGRIVPAFFGMLFIWAFLLNDYNDAIDYLTSGHMDWPVAVIGCACAYMGVAAARAHDVKEHNRNANATIWVAIVTGAIAAITKQAGVMFLAATLILAVASTVLEKSGWRKFAAMLVVAITPLLSFLIFFQASGTRRILGNAEQLSDLSERALGNDRMAGALGLLFTPIHPAVIILLFLGCAGNCIFLKHRQAQYAILLCLLAGIGFWIFSDCCSYQRRNGVWIFGLLIPASLAGLELLSNKFLHSYFSGNVCRRPNQLSPTIIGGSVAMITISISLAMGLSHPNNMALNRQRELQRHIGAEAANTFLYASEKELQNASAIISYYQMMKYLPEFSEKFVYCNSHDIACIRRKSPLFDGAVYVFYDKGRAGNASGTYGRWIGRGRAKIVSETKRFMLLRLTK